MSDNDHSYLNAVLRTKSVTYNDTWLETAKHYDFSDRAYINKEVGIINHAYATFANTLIRNIVNNIK